MLYPLEGVNPQAFFRICKTNDYLAVGRGKKNMTLSNAC